MAMVLNVIINKFYNVKIEIRGFLYAKPHNIGDYNI